MFPGNGLAAAEGFHDALAETEPFFDDPRLLFHHENSLAPRDSIEVRSVETCERLELFESACPVEDLRVVLHGSIRREAAGMPSRLFLQVSGMWGAVSAGEEALAPSRSDGVDQCLTVLLALQ